MANIFAFKCPPRLPPPSEKSSKFGEMNTSHLSQSFGEQPDGSKSKVLENKIHFIPFSAKNPGMWDVHEAAAELGE